LNPIGRLQTACAIGVLAVALAAMPVLASSAGTPPLAQGAKKHQPAKGSSCTRPLEVTKNNPYLRGETKYLFAGLDSISDSDHHGAMQHWSWETKQRNVAICPYPKGVVLVVLQKTSTGFKVTEEVPEHTTAHGGHFEHHITETTNAGLRVRGYFIRPRGSKR
jgi:hypothetical protein